MKSTPRAALVSTKSTSISIKTKHGKPGSKAKTTVIIKNKLVTTAVKGASTLSHLPASSKPKILKDRPVVGGSRSTSTKLALPSSAPASGRIRAKPYIAKADPDTLKRLDRALKERLYLIRHERHPDGTGARFAVLGNTGNVYEVNLGLQPKCACVDFIMKKKPCKHLLFVWLRVLKKRTNNPLVWQQALIASEVKASMSSLFSKGVRCLPCADANILKVFKQSGGVSGKKQRRQKLGCDCPICFEVISANDERQQLVTFCGSCGHNVHVACLKMWQKAAHNTLLAGSCPSCRSRMVAGSSADVAPGAPLPHPSRWGAGVSGRGYMNLAAHSPAHAKGKNKNALALKDKSSSKSKRRR